MSTLPRRVPPTRSAAVTLFLAAVLVFAVAVGVAAVLVLGG